VRVIHSPNASSAPVRSWGVKALPGLAAADLQAAELVRLRYFVGLSVTVTIYNATPRLEPPK
jgi:hypothetical protein